MKRAWQGLSVFLILFSLTVSARAQFGLGIGLGIHGGMDRYEIPALDRSVKLADLTQVGVVREGFKNPVMGGVDLFINTLPVIDLQVSVDASKMTYPVRYIRPNLYNPFKKDTTNYDVPFGRLGVYVSIKKNLVAFPPVLHTLSIYVGGGVGAHFIAPVVSEKYVFDHLKTAAEDLNTDEILKEDIKKNMVYGWHLLIGLRLKVPILPFQIFGEGKMTFVPEGKYEQPSKFPSLYAGIAYML